MDSSKYNKALSSKDVDQLMTAIEELDNSVAYLRKLLQKSIKAQAQVESAQEDADTTPTLPKIIH